MATEDSTDDLCDMPEDVGYVYSPPPLLMRAGSRKIRGLERRVYDAMEPMKDNSIRWNDLTPDAVAVLFVNKYFITATGSRTFLCWSTRLDNRRHSICSMESIGNHCRIPQKNC